MNTAAQQPIQFGLDEFYSRLPEIAQVPPVIGYWVGGEVTVHERNTLRRMNLVYGARVLWQGGRFEITEVRFYEDGQQKPFQYEEVARFVKYEVRSAISILTTVHTPYPQMKASGWEYAARIKAAARINEPMPQYQAPTMASAFPPTNWQYNPTPGAS